MSNRVKAAARLTRLQRIKTIPLRLATGTAAISTERFFEPALESVAVLRANNARNHVADAFVVRFGEMAKNFSPNWPLTAFRCLYFDSAQSGALGIDVNQLKWRIYDGYITIGAVPL